MFNANNEYKGFPITRLFPSGFYEAYIGNRFIKADTLTGLKSYIDNHLKGAVK